MRERSNSFLFEQPPQCSAVTRSISHGSYCPSQNNLNYSSILNVLEGMKFYNIGNKTFETDFKIVYASLVFVTYVFPKDKEETPFLVRKKS